jgi:hypothetical protein
MKKAGEIIFWTAIVSGLVIRYLSLSYNGIFDMATYHEWGLNALKEGLNKAYMGSYFPFQYQIFEFGAFLSVKLKTDYFIIYKIINLVFDSGNIVVLYLIFRKINVSKFYLLLYWLHPWFLIMFSQGYCDFQFTFFILCSILFSFKATSRGYLLAGIFLGFAFLMKPQIQVIVLSLFIYSLYVYYKEKDVKLFSLFIFPAILFIDYSLYFFVTSGNPFRLLRIYVDLGSAMPLTANFLNGWFPVAYFLKEPGTAIYSVTDDMDIMNIRLRTVALLSLLLLIWFYMKMIYKNNINNSNIYNYFLVTGFATFIFPFVMTSAHENHLFLATVLLIPILGKTKNILVKICIHLLLIIQCINLYGFYGFGENQYSSMININYTYELAFILSLIAIVAFTVLMFYFLSPKFDFLTKIRQLVRD